MFGFSEWLHTYFPFLFYNPLLTLIVCALLIVLAFVVDHFLKKLNNKIKAERLAKLNEELSAQNQLKF